MKRVVFTDKQKAEFVDELFVYDHTPTTVCGKTLVSIISVGTELSRFKDAVYPYEPGYGCVFQVESIGEKVKDIRVGDIVFCEGRHQSEQAKDENEVYKIPDGLGIEKAVFARMCKMAESINWSNNAEVCVVGRGLTAYFIKQRFAIKESDCNVVIETTGKEENILKACDIVKESGTVIMFGTPWQLKSVEIAHRILKDIFYRDLRIVGGWERCANAWIKSPQCYAYCLKELLEGGYKVGDIYDLATPDKCQETYLKLLNERTKLTTLFDWREK